MERWGQTLADLRALSVEAKDTRSRERFLALYMIADKRTSACAWARETDAPRRQSSDGYMPTIDWDPRLCSIVIREVVALFSPEQVEQLVSVVCETEPIEHGLPGHTWTLKKLRRWLKQVMNCDVSRSTLHRILRAAQLRWKRCQKVFKKADPQKRAAFMERFQRLYEQFWRQKIRLVYIDEAHIHRDMDLGYTWTAKNKIACV